MLARLNADHAVIALYGGKTKVVSLGAERG